MVLRERIVQSASYLAAREAAVVVLRAGGIVVLTRLLGPADYGRYATVFSINLFLIQVVQLGSDVYLVRRADAPTKRMYDQVFTLLLVVSVLVGVITGLASSLLRPWLDDPILLPLAWAFLALLPITVLPVPAVAQLERDLNFRSVAALEVVEQLIFYGSAVVLAWSGFGVWAPLAGYVASRVWVLVRSIMLAHYTPALHWSIDLLRDVLHYGIGYSLANWIWYCRLLVKPVVVGHYLGPEGVGYLTLAEGLTDGLGFIKRATARLSIVISAQVQRDRERLRRGIEEGLALQVLVLGVPLVAFALVSPWLVPIIFGDRWTPLLVVFPYVALGFLTDGAARIPIAVLYVLKRNGAVATFEAARVILLAVAAVVFVPRVGLIGWGFAEIVAMASYVILYRQMQRLLDLKYRRVLLWLLAVTPPLFTESLGWPLAALLLAPPLIVFAGADARQQLVGYWQELRGKLSLRAA